MCRLLCLSWLLLGVLGACPRNFYESAGYCHPCGRNHTNPDGVGYCTRCPTNHFTPRGSSRRRACYLGNDRRRRIDSPGLNPCYSTSGMPDCMACPAGQMWNSGSGAADCVPCPAGHMSYQGGLCLQTLAFMLEHGPTPSFSAQADNYGLLQLSFQVSFGAVYENISMVYSVDVQPDAGSLSAGAVPCDGLFKWTDRQVGTQTFRNSTKTLTYTELDGACKLGTTFEASEVVRSGVAAVFLCRGTLTECQQVPWLGFRVLALTLNPYRGFNRCKPEFWVDCRQLSAPRLRNWVSR